LGASSPDITTAAINGDLVTIDLVGTNYPAEADYECEITFMGYTKPAYYSTTTQVSASFSSFGGIPITNDPVAPTLYFYLKTDTAHLQNWVATNVAEAKITNAFAGAPTSAAVSCSYGGGCMYALTGAGMN